MKQQPKLETMETNKITAEFESWTKTMNLRYKQVAIEHGFEDGKIVDLRTEAVLQQQSISNLGKTKWDDIQLETNP